MKQKKIVDGDIYVYQNSRNNTYIGFLVIEANRVSLSYTVIDLSALNENINLERILLLGRVKIYPEVLDPIADEILRKIGVQPDPEMKNKYFLFFTDISKIEFFKFNKLNFIGNILINHLIIECGGGTGGIDANFHDLLYSNNPNNNVGERGRFIPINNLLIQKSSNDN
jgi:hypothetical protein